MNKGKCTGDAGVGVLVCQPSVVVATHGSLVVWLCVRWASHLSLPLGVELRWHNPSHKVQGTVKKCANSALQGTHILTMRISFNQFWIKSAPWHGPKTPAHATVAAMGLRWHDAARSNATQAARMGPPTTSIAREEQGATAKRP